MGVSKGPGAARQRIVRDMENEKLGYYNHMEYFDCEMDISETNARGRALMAFMPYNKNPKTLGSIICGGFRQILAYLILYPRVEKCGIYTRWSQSQQNPVTDIEVTVRYEGGENGARMFFRGRKTKLKAYVKANGQPQTRAYRIQLTLESTPSCAFGSLPTTPSSKSCLHPLLAVNIAAFAELSTGTFMMNGWARMAKPWSPQLMPWSTNGSGNAKNSSFLFF